MAITRYAHQVTAASLKILQDHAYQQYQDRELEGQNALIFDKWGEIQCSEQLQLKYWVTTLHLELMLLQFIKFIFIMERNFEMYVQ